MNPNLYNPRYGRRSIARQRSDLRVAEHDPSAEGGAQDMNPKNGLRLSPTAPAMSSDGSLTPQADWSKLFPTAANPVKDPLGVGGVQHGPPMPIPWAGANPAPANAGNGAAPFDPREMAGGINHAAAWGGGVTAATSAPGQSRPGMTESIVTRYGTAAIGPAGTTANRLPLLKKNPWS